jgi:LysM repeat protein
MRNFVIALATAIFSAGALFTPVAAAAPASASASTSCGDTYTVKRGDWLAHIARTCGTTVSEILDLNPEIGNPSRIYPGQVLRLTSDADVTTADTTPTPHRPPQPGQNGYVPDPRYTGSARVTVSATRASAGDEITVSISGFPANANIDVRIGKKGEEATSATYDGVTDANGKTSLTITIPSDAAEGEYWIVHVLTTELTKGVQAYSHSIYITD